MSSGSDRVRAATEKLGLHHGRMISGSKSAYRRAYPHHVVVFNAALADAHGNDLWRGDLDLTVDEPKLVSLAADLGATLHLLYEGDARLIGKPDPYQLDLAPAVVRITPDGETILNAHWRVPKVGRNREGRLVWVRSE